jgi:glycosyltransferase involved in cell wall biosynthesis
VARLPQVVDAIKPDLIFVNNDPWNVIKFAEATTVPVVGYMPVDAPNMLNDVAQRLNKTAFSIFYTDFGLSTARMAGYRGEAFTMPHGVDTNQYKPMPKQQAREALTHTQDAFIVGNVNRNQPRKRLDLTVMAFAAWIKEYKINDAVLHLHCGLRDQGWDLPQLNRYFGIDDKVWFTDNRMTETIGVDEKVLPYVYNAFDVQLSTSFGEGWGLTTMEGMACGTPQIVPEWAALAEWPNGAVRYMPISSISATAGNINSLGGMVSEESVVNALHYLYKHPDVRQEYGELGRKLVNQPRYDWRNIGSFLADYLSVYLSTGRANPYLKEEDAASGRLSANSGGFEGAMEA